MTMSLNRVAALGDQLAAVLRAKIISGQLVPGTHLVEDALASDHDVSRGPVRDAFKVLLAEGLVDNRRRGFFVRGFTADDIEELYALREAVEQLACRLTITAAPMDWSRAERELAAMNDAADRGDWHTFASHDLAFHTEFYRMAGYPRLARLWQQYLPTFAVLLDITNARDLDLHPSADDHRLLLTLAQTGQSTEFAATLSAHLAGSKERMRAAIADRQPRASAD